MEKLQHQLLLFMNEVHMGIMSCKLHQIFKAAIETAQSSFFPSHKIHSIYNQRLSFQLMFICMVSLPLCVIPEFH